MPCDLSPSPPSSSLHHFPFSLPLHSILVWYCLSIAYKYPRVWPHQGQAIVAHLFSRLCALEGNGAPFSLDQPGQLWPSPSLKPTPLFVLGSSET